MLTQCSKDSILHYYDYYGYFQYTKKKKRKKRNLYGFNNQHFDDKNREEMEEALYDWANEEYGDEIYNNGLDNLEVAVKCREYNYYYQTYNLGFALLM